MVHQEPVRQGDERAAEQLFAQYVGRLTALARARLSPRLSARTDPEDVVLSAYRSFFVAAREGQFTLARSGDLWRLLVAITLHKLYRQVRRHEAASRSAPRLSHLYRTSSCRRFPRNMSTDLQRPSNLLRLCRVGATEVVAPSDNSSRSVHLSTARHVCQEAFRPGPPAFSFFDPLATRSYASYS